MVYLKTECLYKLYDLYLIMCYLIEWSGSICIYIEADLPENNGKNLELPSLLVFLIFAEWQAYFLVSFVGDD